MSKRVVFGISLVCLSLIIALLIYFPLIKQEARYLFTTNQDKTTVVVNNNLEQNNDQTNVLVPVDKQFGIVIPKINANSKVIANVNPNNSAEYQQALTKGVAHAQNTMYPGQGGNTFLFAHSSDNFVNANRYNSVFYLLYKLNENDSIYIAYNNNLYEYKVTNKQYVNPEQVEYLSPNYGVNTLSLMTCWPPGTTNKRLIVTAKLVEPKTITE